jgi:hypothetical protein
VDLKMIGFYRSGELLVFDRLASSTFARKL